MPDISMCKDKTCPSRASCYRYRARPSKYRQAYSDYSCEGKERCEHYQSTSGWDDRYLVPMVEIESKEMGV